MTVGKVATINADVCRGWAKIAALPRYAVTVHLVLDDRVQASAIADQSAETTEELSVSGDCWFQIDVPGRVATRLTECRVLVGESGRYLQDARGESGTVAASPASRQTPASYRDALDRGLSDSDVIELLYLDILRRPADKKGLGFHVDELETGRGSFESFRRSLLASDEYCRLTLDVREAPGGTFSRPIVYSASTRRLKMEQHAAGFQRLEEPVRGKLLNYLPGLVAVPGAIESLVALANKGLSQREIFYRALSKLSHRPSLIVADRHDSAWSHDIEAPNDNCEITLACHSPLFSQGWNKLEQSPTEMYRWMEQVGILLNPRPERQLKQLEVSVEAWYGDLDQTITAVAGNMVLACERRVAGGGGKTLIFTPPDASPIIAPRVALVADASACPWRYDGTPDKRLLSCQVTAAKFQYDGGSA